MNERTLLAEPMSATLQHRFSAVVARHPGAVAVRDSRASLTYAELDREVDRLAAELLTAGVRPRQLVPISVRPSIAAVAAILAVLRIGAGYVPLDRKAPIARLRGVVDRCRPTVVVADAESGLTGPDGSEPELALYPGVFLRPWGQLELTREADDTAYVMFTSGSTGLPKGVVVSHSAILHYLDWAMPEYGVEAGTGAPLFSSFAFDLSLTSLFGPLLHGRTVQILDPESWLLDFLDRPDGFAEFSFIKATPSHLTMLCTALEQERLTVDCRLLIVGGEPLYADQVGFWRQTLRSTALVNEYGPTEAAVGCCRYWVPADPPPGLLPIGDASPGTVLELRDEAGVISGPGRGELFIGGPQLADGYLDDPATTARSFLDVGGGAPGRRYRTGDLVVRSAGTCDRFTFLGRQDGQAKMAGHRIELGEIVSQARAWPEVADAEATVLHGGPTDRLVLFVTRTAGREVALVRLIDHLAAQLPSYMVPHKIVVVDRFPLNERGKVDRSRLEELLDD